MATDDYVTVECEVTGLTQHAARLVTEQPRGTRRIYAVDPEGLASLREYVETFWDDVLQAFAEKAKEETGASP